MFRAAADAASAAAADERERLQQLVAAADAAVVECKAQWQSDVKCLQQQADAAAAAAAAHQLSVELSLKGAIKQEQQQKASAMETCRCVYGDHFGTFDVFVPTYYRRLEAAAAAAQERLKASSPLAAKRFCAVQCSVCRIHR